MKTKTVYKRSRSAILKELETLLKDLGEIDAWETCTCPEEVQEQLVDNENYLDDIIDDLKEKYTCKSTAGVKKRKVYDHTRASIIADVDEIYKDLDDIDCYALCPRGVLDKLGCACDKIRFTMKKLTMKKERN